MKPVKPDLRGLKAHVRKWHTDQPEKSWPAELRDLARLHAVWHRFVIHSHKHGGTVVPMQYGPIFSVWPLGCFTGRELETVELTAKAVRTRNRAAGHDED
jgi:hypothetical protein